MGSRSFKRTRVDYEAGELIRLTSTPQSLEKRRNALRKAFAHQCLPMLKRENASDAATRDLARNRELRCVVEPLPWSSMLATNSTLAIEDTLPIKAAITVAMLRR